MEKNLPPKQGKAAVLKDLLSKDSVKQSMLAVIPKHLTPERVLKMALIAASRQPKLYECTQESILRALMTSAELGIDCSGTLGRGYMIPYFNGKTKKLEAQFQIGYQGLIDLARRSGELAAIACYHVYKDDEFEVNYATFPPIKHKPNFDVELKDENIILTYAVAQLKSGFMQTEIMTRSQVEAIRRRSKAADGDAWKNFWGEMSRKTVAKRICKYLPLSIELERALVVEGELDRELYGGSIPETPVEIPTTNGQTAISGFSKRISNDVQKVKEGIKPEAEEAKLISEDQVAQLYEKGLELGLEKDTVDIWLTANYDLDDARGLTEGFYQVVLLAMKNDSAEFKFDNHPNQASLESETEKIPTPLNSSQITEIYQVGQKAGLDRKGVNNWLKMNYDTPTAGKLTTDKYDKVLQELKDLETIKESDPPEPTDEPSEQKGAFNPGSPEPEKDPGTTDIRPNGMSEVAINLEHAFNRCKAIERFDHINEQLTNTDRIRQEERRYLNFVRDQTRERVGG